MISLKYYYEFRSLKRNTYRVEIYENTTLPLTPIDVVKSFSGLSIQFKELESKFDTVIGSGATFDLLAKTTFQFIDLYTGDIKKYQVRCYRDGAVIWIGWLNTEYYQEDFSRAKNVQIDLTASDFTILERIQYLDENMKPYEGIASLYSILTTCISKLELPFRYLYIASSITPGDIALAASESILHVEYNKNRNFYDEDYKALDCKAVIESVLKTFLLSIKQVEGDLFIYDVEALVNGTAFKKYDAQTFAYLGVEAIPTNAGQIEQIGYTSDSSTFSIIPSFNRAKLTYSTFKQSDIVEASVDSFNVSTSMKVETKADVRSGLDYSYKVEQFKNASGFSFGQQIAGYYGCPTVITPTGEYIKNESPIAGIMLYNRAASTEYQKLFYFTAKLPFLINESSDYALKIEAKILTSRVDNPIADGKTVDNNINPCVQVLVPFRLYLIEKVVPLIGSAGTPYNHTYYNSYDNTPLINGTGADRWVSFNSPQAEPQTESMLQFCDWGAATSIDNRWTGCKNIAYSKDYTGPRATPVTTDYYIPLPAGTYGELGFCIVNGTNPLPKAKTGSITPKMILMNDLKLSIVDRTTAKTIDLTDVEYTSYVNKQFKGDADDIEQVIGTNKQAFPNENGSLLQWDAAKTKYYFSRIFTKSGETAEIEKLALRTFISNYKSKTASLEVELKNTFKPLGYLTTKYIEGSKLMISGYKLNCKNDSVEVLAAEIFNDTLSINSIEYEPN